jgi:KaiC/GvpD/RAD55 family RecA-like ATPase
MKSPSGEAKTFHLVRLLQSYSKHYITTKTLMDVRLQAESDHRKPEPERRIPASAIQLRPDEVDRLVARYNETKNMRQVAREFRMSRTTIREHLRKRGIRVRSAKPMTDAQKKLARQLYEAGEPSTIIGKKLGFSHHTILRAVRTTT